MNRQLMRHLVRERIRPAGSSPDCHPALASYISKHITRNGNTLSFSEQNGPHIGVLTSKWYLTPRHSYFEIEITDPGRKCRISVGLGSKDVPLDCEPGVMPGSVAYHADDGKLFEGNTNGVAFGPKCKAGDRIGCGVRFDQRRVEGSDRKVPVFFTLNGQELGSVLMPLKQEMFHPSIGLVSEGESVTFIEGAEWKDVTLMAVDNFEEDWGRLHDIHLNGQTLEYVGKGKSIVDIGLAQAKQPLDTRNHYFEIQIADPGDNCYIAIGLTCKNYPSHRHPGWNRGSIAYHADDGKIFVGYGMGEAFGPKCHKGDVMGCGILFPRDFNLDMKGAGSDDETEDLSDKEDFIEEDNSEPYSDPDDSEDEDRERKEEKDPAMKVTVFFTRNRATVGRRQIALPKGGLFPTVGMLSCYEKVFVDLRPMTG